MTNSTDFPRDPAKFRAWADEACREWPMELTAFAYHCWCALDGQRGYTPSCVDVFAAAYAAHVLSGSSA